MVRRVVGLVGCLVMGEQVGEGVGKGEVGGGPESKTKEVG
jgi:hypothetical protein